MDWIELTSPEQPENGENVRVRISNAELVEDVKGQAISGVYSERLKSVFILGRWIPFTEEYFSGWNSVWKPSRMVTSPAKFKTWGHLKSK